MRKYLILAVLLWVGLSACRKRHFLPAIKAFNEGEYFYDLTIKENHYENALTLVIQKSAEDRDKDAHPEVLLYESVNYDIFELNNIRLFKFNLISYLSDLTYSVFNAGLYKRHGGGLLSPDYQVLRVPFFDYNIDHISIYLTCTGKDHLVNIEKPFNIQVKGKEYEVYKMKLPAEYDCENNRQHTIYVDRNYGIVRYVVEDIGTEALVYQLDFNHYEGE